MTENTAIGKLSNGADPQAISREIITGLANTGRFGYHATFEESTSDQGGLKITLVTPNGQQEIFIPNWIWRERGRIREAIMEELKI